MNKIDLLSAKYRVKLTNINRYNNIYRKYEYYYISMFGYSTSSIVDLDCTKTVFIHNFNKCQNNLKTVVYYKPNL